MNISVFDNSNDPIALIQNGEYIYRNNAHKKLIKKNILQDGEYFIENEIYDVSTWEAGENITGILFHSITKLKKENKELEDLASKDSMTGLLNRKSAEDKIKYILEKNDNTDYLYMLCDINKFKQINDIYGHPAGDKAIIMFADFLKENFRSNDILYRLGGDEFAVFLALKQKEEAEIIGQRLVENISDLCVEYNDKIIPINSGFGLAIYDNDSFESLYKKADDALYAAKEEKSKYMIK